MLLAVTTWNERVAPVFDVARSVHLVELDAHGIVREEDGALPAVEAPGKVAALVARGVTVLICGAITRDTECLARDSGMEVVPFVAGGVEEVVAAWRSNTLGRPELRMPGCHPGQGARRAWPTRRPRRRGRAGR